MNGLTLSEISVVFSLDSRAVVYVVWGDCS
jgi:hypothetical protein